MVNFLFIVKTLKTTNINVRGLGQVVVDPATIEVGNNSVVARCRVVGSRGCKTIKCYLTSHHRSDIKGVKYYPQSLAVYGFGGRVEYIDVAISRWVDGRALDIVVYSEGCDFRALSKAFDIMAFRHLQSGVIHGDIKPENIVVLRSGQMRLVDSDYLPTDVNGRYYAKDYGSEYYTHPLRQIRRTDEYTDHYPLALMSTFLAAIVFVPDFFDVRRSVDEYIDMAAEILSEHNDIGHYNLMVAMRDSIMGKVEGIEALFESIVVTYE